MSPKLFIKSDNGHWFILSCGWIPQKLVIMSKRSLVICELWPPISWLGHPNGHITQCFRTSKQTLYSLKVETHQCCLIYQYQTGDHPKTLTYFPICFLNYYVCGNIVQWEIVWMKTHFFFWLEGHVPHAPFSHLV